MNRHTCVAAWGMTLPAAAALVFLGAPRGSLGQSTTDGAAPAARLDAAARSRIIDGVLEKLNTSYVFPETAKKMETALRERAAKKEYDAITDGGAFARTLTEHLQAVSKDGHLRVFYSATPHLLPTAGTAPRTPDAEEQARRRRIGAMTNFGFEKVERLGGNIGYLEVRGFAGPEVAGEKAAAAMTFLADTDALIIDLRRNGGGEPAMVALLCSYLFGPEPVHLNDLYFRPTNTTEQFFTLRDVPGKRYGLDKPVYVLTSKRTFSGAEEFTYNLKNLKRATIVGETTGGGAHPGGVEPLNEHFAVFIPSGRAINPITKTNWEGTGVAPDVAVPADQALKTAYIAALKKALDKTTDENLARQLRETIETQQKELEALKKG